MPTRDWHKGQYRGFDEWKVAGSLDVALIERSTERTRAMLVALPYAIEPDR